MAGGRKAAHFAAFAFILLLSAGTSRAELAQDVLDAVATFIGDHKTELLQMVVQGKAKEIPAYIAEQLAAQYAPEIIQEISQSSPEIANIVDDAISTATELTACAGSVAGAAAVGSIVPVIGSFVAGAVTWATNPACKNALQGAGQLVGDVLGSGSQSPAPPKTCGAGEVAMEDISACIQYCEQQTPGCSSWFMHEGCCLCKSYCTTTSSTEGSPAPYSPAPESPAPYSPSPDGTVATCDSITFESETDLKGGDIIPVTTKWADTAVAAASPGDCCDICSLYTYCQAWTFTKAKECKDRLPGAPGCCFLKKASDWTAEPASGMTSGVMQGRAAQCTFEFDTDLSGGDILTSSGDDTVVATYSDADCCQSCAATPGCGAWTMTPPSDCEDRLPGVAGCCFLKYSSGWTRATDDKGVKTSGVLLAPARR